MAEGEPIGRIATGEQCGYWRCSLQSFPLIEAGQEEVATLPAQKPMTSGGMTQPSTSDGMTQEGWGAWCGRMNDGSYPRGYGPRGPDDRRADEDEPPQQSRHRWGKSHCRPLCSQRDWGLSEPLLASYPPHLKKRTDWSLWEGVHHVRRIEGGRQGKSGPDKRQGYGRSPPRSGSLSLLKRGRKTGI